MFFTPSENQTEASLKGDEDAAASKASAKPKQAVTCRTCKGAHFSLQCPFRSEIEALRSCMDSSNGDSQNPDPLTKVTKRFTEVPILLLDGTLV